MARFAAPTGWARFLARSDRFGARITSLPDRKHSESGQRWRCLTDPLFGVRDEMVVDQTRTFGRPIFARGRARLEDALSLFRAGESVAAGTASSRAPRSLPRPLPQPRPAPRTAGLHVHTFAEE